MNVGFLGDVQNLNASRIYGSSGVSGADTSAEFDDCEVTAGSGMTTFRVGLSGQTPLAGVGSYWCAPTGCSSAGVNTLPSASRRAGFLARRTPAAITQRHSHPSAKKGSRFTSV